MKKNLLYFIDNIDDAISLQQDNLKIEIKNHIIDSMKLKPTINEKENYIRFDNSMKVYFNGKSITINKDDLDRRIEDFIKEDIMPLFDDYDIIQFAIDCNLDYDDRINTSYKLINKLLEKSKDKRDKIIITIVSAYYYKNEHQIEIINSLNQEIINEVKFLPRPMINELNVYNWDDKRSSNGRYELGDILFEISDNKDERPYEIIEELLYDDRASANYFGMLLVRFLKEEKIDKKI